LMGAMSALPASEKLAIVLGAAAHC